MYDSTNRNFVATDALDGTFYIFDVSGRRADIRMAIYTAANQCITFTDRTCLTLPQTLELYSFCELLNSIYNGKNLEQPETLLCRSR